MRVIKRNGEAIEVEFDEITRKIKTLANKTPVLNIDIGKLAREVIGLIYDGISTSELDEFTASISANMSVYNSDYEELAGRLIINNHIKNTKLGFCDTMISLSNLLSDDLINLCNTKKDEIESLIVEERDYLISYFGFCTLNKSYLLKKNDKTLERPQYLYMRVALAIHGDDFYKVKETYDLLSLKYFTHATPTLFSAGTKFPQMSSCYLIGTQDSVTGIYKTISDVAQISKWAGGVGVHISNIRSEGSKISSTNGDSRGIMPMLKVYNDTARYINQSGRRSGSFAMYLEPWHSDVFTFLEAKKNNGADEIRARDLFYALWIPDLFMNRLREKGTWSLMCPNECPGLSDCYGEEFEQLYKQYESEGKFVIQIDILKLWNAIINSQIETGTPYMLYKDAVNRKSNQKNIGVIKSSNLCTEIMEYSDHNETAVCNLASICLPQFLDNADLSYIYDVKVYSKTVCSYCVLAKELLNNNNIKYEEILLDDDEERLSFYEEHGTFENPVNTVPQIFINGIRIGGFNDLKNVFKKKINYAKLGQVVETVVENLNIIIDKNFYPTQESKNSNILHRPIGIGIQGLADLYMLLELPFTSDEAKNINKAIFETIYYYALKKSNKLACQYGSYETFKGSPASKGILQFDLWDKKPQYYSEVEWDYLKEDIINNGLRNSLLVAPMPTASTAQIMGNNESFEPYTSNIYTRRVLAGEFVLVNKHLVKYLKSQNLYTKKMIDSIILERGSVQNLDIPKEAKEIFKTVWEISQKTLLEMSADRGIFICQSQSLNIFIEKADPKIINSVHLYGHSLGLKTGSYYIRTKPVLSSQNFSMDYEIEREQKQKQEQKQEQRQDNNDCLMCSG
jgi:ribonucleoside-diphosphate reductase alpha subunit